MHYRAELFSYYKCSRWTYFKWVSRGQNWSNYPGINDLTAAVGNARLCVGCGELIGEKTYLFLIVEHCGGLTSCPRHLTLLSFLILMKYFIHLKKRQKTKVMLYFVKLENNGSYKKYCLTTFVSIHQQQVWYVCEGKNTENISGTIVQILH